LLVHSSDPPLESPARNPQNMFVPLYETRPRRPDDHSGAKRQRLSVWTPAMQSSVLRQAEPHGGRRVRITEVRILERGGSMVVRASKSRSTMPTAPQRWRSRRPSGKSSHQMAYFGSKRTRGRQCGNLMPTAPRPTRCVPTSCGCGSPQWPTS
jgi:hypothetical protein